jgi:hypothetical protein
VAYHEEIVYAPSADQRWLAGVLMRPNQDARRPVGVICIHGANGFFYSPHYVALGRALAERGYLYLSGNTRAHDVGSMDFPWPLDTRPETGPKIHLGGAGWSRCEEALAAYEHALQLDPNLPESWAGKGYTLNDLWRYDEAAAAFARALAINPNDANAWRNKAISLRVLGRTAEEREAERRARALRAQK